MDRWQEIVNRSVEEEYKDMFGFQAGADWADNHPSEETIRKVLVLSAQWHEDMDTVMSEQQYIQEHWDDEH